ncbi:hypothetical protein [Apilactobacillus ozensis]|uniref:hypothetical protein n=1 Tax=Apilactobacillus ozensis TaxID=866801 RepID=UPI0006D0ABFE|nr:hypothetical protein [Apilactobacillus ozensis]
MKFNKLTKVFLTASMVLPLAVAPVAANASQNGSNAKTEKVTKNNKTQSFALGEAGNKFKKSESIPH